MRILQLPSWYLPEGGQFCLNQSLALQEKGIKIHILANIVLPLRRYNLRLLKYPFKAFFTKEDGVLTYKYYSWRFPVSDSINTKKWIKKTLNLFDEYVKKEGLPDIIHAHSSMWGGYAAALIKKKYGIPYLITEHRGRYSENSYKQDGLFKEFYKPYLESAFLNADKIITVSDQLHKKIKEYGNSNIETISNIIDSNFFTFDKIIKKSAFTFINANSYDFAKGYDILLPAFDKLCQKFPESRLIILGDKFNTTEFQEIYNKRSFKRNIILLGHQNKEGVRKYLNSSNSFVLSSRIESQSSAVLEAMCCGLPVVCTDVVPAEIAKSEYTIQCKKNNIEELSEAMKKMIIDYNNYDPSSIRNFAISICSKEIVTQKIINVYKSILNK